MCVQILTVNAGSASIKLALFRTESGALLRRAACNQAVTGGGYGPAVEDFLAEYGTDPVSVVAHRVVHGGTALTAPVVVDAGVEAEIERLIPLAPLHNPPALAGLRACRRVLPASVPQVAVFDTGYYADLPEVAHTYALPRDWCAAHGIRRFGFHGIAHQSLQRRWRALRPELPGGGRVISLQLGAGNSMTAVAEGRVVETSMGFTPLEGLAMATRAGDVDPGILLYAQRELGMDVRELDEMLSRRSGLLGLSGQSADMRDLLADGGADARRAIDVYCHRIRKYLGAYLAVLDGADAILLGGGIGEHAAPIRERVLSGFAHAGIFLDPEANAALHGEGPIHAAHSRAQMYVFHTDEETVLAEAALDILHRQNGPIPCRSSP